MKLLSTFIVSFLVIGPTFCFGEEFLSGEYKNLVAEDSGKVGHLLLHPISKDKYEFSLKLNRGKPSYNSGHLYGVITFKGSVASFISDEFEFKSKICELKFSHNNESIVISTENSNNRCGFGFGVYADGTYSKTSSEVPATYIDALGNDVAF